MFQDWSRDNTAHNSENCADSNAAAGDVAHGGLLVSTHISLVGSSITTSRSNRKKMISIKGEKAKGNQIHPVLPTFFFGRHSTAIGKPMLSTRGRSLHWNFLHHQGKKNIQSCRKQSPFRVLKKRNHTPRITPRPSSSKKSFLCADWLVPPSFPRRATLRHS